MLKPIAEHIPGFRFSVTFLVGGAIPNPLDTRFQTVSGLSSSVDTDTIGEGGENIFVTKVPTKMSYQNLTLKRGMVVGSPLNVEFNAAMSALKFAPSNVLVSALDKDGMPLLGAGWLFQRAFPVKWSVSDFNASQSEILIETLELTFARMQHLRV